MKRIFTIPFLLDGMLLLTVSCNEELQIATYDQEAPSIASFTPTTGPVGTLVTVRGAVKDDTVQSLGTLADALHSAGK